MRKLKIAKENAFFQIVYSLKTNRENRNRHGFLFEGVRAINNALEQKWRIKALFYSSEKGLSAWAQEILARSNADLCCDLSSDLLHKLSDKEASSELLALAEIPGGDLATIAIKKDLLALVLDRPSNPGNLGTLIRSCDALGVDGLVVTGHAADVYDPETVRATTGSLFSLPIVRLPSHKELKPWLDKLREECPTLKVVGADEKGAVSIYDYDFRGPILLLAGNETRGLSANYRQLADDMVKIPMQGTATSLNVAVATSIILAEVNRQRQSLAF
jgi:TrmH family RNA methyltransferase